MRDAATLIKLRYIRKEKDGRLYVRRNDRSLRLYAEPGSEAFIAEYHAAIAKLAETKPKPPGRDDPESFAWLCLRFYASEEFKALAPSTQKMRRRILDGVCHVHGTKPYAMLEEKHVYELLGDQTGGPEAANSLLKSIRGLYVWAIAKHHAKTNPGAQVRKLKVKSDGFYTWTLDDVAAFEARHPSGSKARLALALLLFAGGPRRSDVVRLGRQMIKDGWLTYKTVKGAATVTVPVMPELEAELAHVPRNQMTFLVTEYGKPFTAAGFGNRFRAWCDEAGVKEGSAHGLRKAAATILAENGATEAQLRAIFGWDENSNEPRRYTRAARSKRLAAEGMKLFARRGGSRG